MQCETVIVEEVLKGSILDMMTDVLGEHLKKWLLFLEHMFVKHIVNKPSQPLTESLLLLGSDKVRQYHL